MSTLLRHRFFALLGALTLLFSLNLSAADAREQVLLKTSKGDIVIELYADQAPAIAKNFLRLVDSLRTAAPAPGKD